MSIGVSGSEVSCSGDTCTVTPGATFSATVSVDAAPDTGYILVQSFVNYGTNLTYSATDEAADEVLWPDVASDQVVVRGEVGAGQVNHGGLTGLIPPLPVSEYEGPVFEIELTCTDGFSSTNLQLLPAGDAVALTNGAMFTDGDAVQVTPKTNSVTVNCGEDPGGDGLPGDGGLPGTGTGLSGSGSTNMIWVAIAALAVAGVAGLGVSGLRVARARQEK